MKGLALHNGTVSEIDVSLQRARVFIPDLNIQSYWLACLEPHSLDSASYWMPDVNQPVWILADEQLRDGVILGGFYHGKNPAVATNADLILHKTKNGSSFSWDRSLKSLIFSVVGGLIQFVTSGGASISLNADGSIVLTCTNLTINAPSGISISAGSGVKISTASHTLNGKESLTLDSLDNAGDISIDRGW